MKPELKNKNNEWGLLSGILTMVRLDGDMDFKRAFARIHNNEDIDIWHRAYFMKHIASNRL